MPNLLGMVALIYQPTDSIRMAMLKIDQPCPYHAFITTDITL